MSAAKIYCSIFRHKADKVHCKTDRSYEDIQKIVMLSNGLYKCYHLGFVEGVVKELKAASI